MMARDVDVVVYTDTNGVLQLANVEGQMVEIFLYDGDKLPVPRCDASIKDNNVSQMSQSVR